ncbi:hypothetical protein [uncultured Salinicola sp.]|uniref:hypothetical protein n=1 Tax=uncultured Salinicola sp. TaxID=1193542 RepID=UPI002639ABA2|nr:hypothetical protein [uncultured Salinicola sp.]
MLAALAKAERIAPAPSIDGDAANGKLSKGARKRRNRRVRKEAERKAKRNAERPLHGCKIRFDHGKNRIDWDHYKNRKANEGERMAVLAPGELDDDISDLFPPIPAGFDNTIEELDGMLEAAYGKVPPVAKPAKPFKAWNEDGTVYLGEEVLKLAAEIKAERKAEAKAAAAEARKIRNAEKRAAGLPLRAPARKKILTGRDIPGRIRGRVTVTGTINAKTGEALVIDVAFRNTVHQGIIVWAGAVQPTVTAAAEKGKAIDLVISQPANDRFKPSVRSAA